MCPQITASPAPDLASQSRTDRSSPAEAIRRPSGLKATARTSSVCPLRTARGCFGSCRFQSLTVWSKLAEAIVRPSGLNATAATGPPCLPKALWIRWPSRASQTRIECVERAATRVRPSGLQARSWTAPGEPSKLSVGRPESTA